MSIRSRRLPTGWYPDSAEGIREIFKRWETEVDAPARDRTAGSGSEAAPDREARSDVGPKTRTAVAGVAPHAGWSFSGVLAYKVVRSFVPDAETVVVIGGHLRPGEPTRVAMEDRFATPLGDLENDAELLSELSGIVEMVTDRAVDNTVEVQLPIVKYFFPESRILHLRAAPSQDSVTFGESIHSCARRLGRSVRVLGSTDLTHYGPSYGMTNEGRGEKAHRWVTQINDRRIIDALLNMDLENALHLANDERSACSAGAAVAAAAFARSCGSGKGTLVDYYTSRDIHPSDSFVGYGGIVYGGEAP